MIALLNCPAPHRDLPPPLHRGHHDVHAARMDALTWRTAARRWEAECVAIAARGRAAVVTSGVGCAAVGIGIGVLGTLLWASAL